MSEIQPASINIFLNTLPVGQKGFGMPLVLDNKAVKYYSKILTVNSGLKWTSRTGGVVYVHVVYVVSGNNTVLAVARTGAGTSVSPYLITVTVGTDGAGLPTSTATQVKTAAEAVSNVAGVTGIVDISLIGTGAGVVSAVAETTLSYERYLEITDAGDLLTGDGNILSSDDVYKACVAIFSQSPRPAKVSIYFVIDYANIATEIANLINSGKNAWYKVGTTSRSITNIHLVADTIGALEKQFFGCNDDIAVLSNRTLLREIYLMHKTPGSFPEFAWIGRTSPEQPGSITYAYKQLSGITESGYSKTETTGITASNGNVVADYKGVHVTYEGKTMSGQYIDILDARDYVKARLEEAIASMNINNAKIPFTQAGFRMYEKYMSEVLNEAGKIGIIAPVETEDDQTRSSQGKWQWKLTFPDTVSDVPTNDRANRKLSITGSLRVQGAIHTVDIDLEFTA